MFGKKKSKKPQSEAADMRLRLPARETFDALRFTIWSIFEIALMLIAMFGVIAVAIRHIP